MFIENNVSYKSGERAQIPITLNFHSQSRTAMQGKPVVTEIKLNDITLCSDSSATNNENVNGGQLKKETKKDDKCVKFEMSEAQDGQWNGSLTFYSIPSSRYVRFDYIFKKPENEAYVIN